MWQIVQIKFVMAMQDYRPIDQPRVIDLCYRKAGRSTCNIIAMVGPANFSFAGRDSWML